MPPSLFPKAFSKRRIRKCCNTDGEKIIFLPILRDLLRQKKPVFCPDTAASKTMGIGIDKVIDISADPLAIRPGHLAEVTGAVQCQRPVHPGESGRPGATQNLVEQVERSLSIDLLLNTH